MRYGGLTSLGKSYKQIYDGYFHSKFLISNPGTKDFVYFFIGSGGFLTAKSQNIPLLVFIKKKPITTNNACMYISFSVAFLTIIVSF
jgi:hypothetical protein